LVPRFAANLTLLFQSARWPNASSQRAMSGFDGGEVLFPYTSPDWPKAFNDAGLPVALINTPAPDWQTGGRGVAAVPGQEARFRAGFDQALEMAQRVQAAHDTLVANLFWAVVQAGDQPLMIEPINRFDIPGYFQNDYDQAAEILDMLNAPTLALQFDAYHAHRITGGAKATWGKHGRRAAHVQVAGHPGRHEPTGGEIDHPAFFRARDAEGYGGWVSGEYHPSAKTEAGVDWIG
jgi:hydroxypyruvate isomerase